MVLSLTQKKDFEALKKEGTWIQNKSFFLVYRKNRGLNSRFAWAFMVRGNKRAVFRNKLKRWGREFMRKKRLAWPEALDVLIGTKKTPSIQKINYENFCGVFEEICKQIN